MTPAENPIVVDSAGIAELWPLIERTAQLRDEQPIALAERLLPAAKALLAEKGYDPVLGARPLRRTRSARLPPSTSSLTRSALSAYFVPAR